MSAAFVAASPFFAAKSVTRLIVKPQTMSSETLQVAAEIYYRLALWECRRVRRIYVDGWLDIVWREPSLLAKNEIDSGLERPWLLRGRETELVVQDAGGHASVRTGPYKRDSRRFLRQRRHVTPEDS
jgi:hypothetical protein